MQNAADSRPVPFYPYTGGKIFQLTIDTHNKKGSPVWIKLHLYWWMHAVLWDYQMLFQDNLKELPHFLCRWGFPYIGTHNIFVYWLSQGQIHYVWWTIRQPVRWVSFSFLMDTADGLFSKNQWYGTLSVQRYWLFFRNIPAVTKEIRHYWWNRQFLCNVLYNAIAGKHDSNCLMSIILFFL